MAIRLFPPEELYYISHINNLQSILEKGILSYERIKHLDLPPTPILNKSHNKRAVSQRKAKSTPTGRCLLDYASLYFQPRNAMMYGVLRAEKRGAKKKEKLVVISISNKVLHEPDVFVTDGNAANELTKIYSLSEGLKIPERQWKTVQNSWWNEDDGSKRRIMAECLILDSVKPDLISSIFVADDEALDLVRQIVGERPICVVSKPDIFFQPRFKAPIGEYISLINDGDMFFSTMQTLTITVNLQGIMGKGLALRAKHQFPDVYVKYEDACRNKKIRAERPYLYKRETSFNQQLADPSLPPPTSNVMKWFLLFATKRKWRDDSRLDDIEGGLDWVKRNCGKGKIESLAMPALGCGLGNLSWVKVGPLMCKYLHGIGIPVEIYLPREHKIDPQHLEESYLLGDLANRASPSEEQLPLFKPNSE